MDDGRQIDDTAARSLIGKVREFASSLEDDERALFAALLAPGIDAAWTDGADEVEVAGFGLEWRPDRLPGHLVRAIQDAHLRITAEDDV
jgi:hypothetical protein